MYVFVSSCNIFFTLPFLPIHRPTYCSGTRMSKLAIHDAVAVVAVATIDVGTNVDSAAGR